MTAWNDSCFHVGCLDSTCLLETEACGCWHADGSTHISNILLHRGWRLKPEELKDGKAEKKIKTRATGQLNPVCNERTGLCVRGVSGAAAATCSEPESGGGGGGMKAPRRPRQPRRLLRFCVCGVGLIAAAWIVHFSDVAGAWNYIKLLWCQILN